MKAMISGRSSCFRPFCFRDVDEDDILLVGEDDSVALFSINGDEGGGDGDLDGLTECCGSLMEDSLNPLEEGDEELS